MDYILKTTNLTKTLNNNDVVSALNMQVKRGEIYGFLGPNGAGKTTTLKLIVNLLKPNNGEIEIFGEKLKKDSYDVLKRIGAIIETPVFYEKLTAVENLKLHCEYMGLYDYKVINEVLNLVDLKEIENKKVKDFSLGMKQRLGIARAIITKPEFLILDEPINGLDPIGIKAVRELFTMLNKEYGTTILISSHILTEIEQIADTIGVINKGVLIEQVSMESIRESNKEYLEVVTNGVTKAAYILENELNITNFKVMDNNIIRIYDLITPQNIITKALIIKDINIESISKKVCSLEEHFIRLLGGNENA